ncbi:helix-turn-helix domain-containing protein [Mycobacterium paraterrae]|uniref:Helix-turn-helix transcriptional regulator n=1 Tax=Mycobacterium paraterrae TaxID=577492 RepID=A0ABY3VGI5_9MYCO|nr:helix-turn-helix transcriptional regulator [Mycobacterium paraterrae]UMB68530.1 helix-turn-helix transcriptional regulator [Mycobacterium paraterrae]
MTTLSRTPRATPAVGQLLREWRERRRISQLDLSIQAEVSARHLSFVETGRSQPTPDMILRLSEQLDVPLRERNALLLAGGYAPVYPEHSLDEPELTRFRAAMRQILAGHQPYPALVIDRWWDMLDGNAAIAVLIEGCDPALLTPPINAMRVSLHPDGMAPRIVNLPEWRAHALERLHRQVRATRDPRLAELLDEVTAYPGGAAGRPEPTDVAVPLRLRHNGKELAFFSIIAVVGAPLDVTVAEVAIESFYPADAETAEALHSMGK